MKHFGDHRLGERLANGAEGDFLSKAVERRELTFEEALSLQRRVQARQTELLLGREEIGRGPEWQSIDTID